MNSITKFLTSIIVAAISLMGIIFPTPTDYDAPIDKINGGDPYIIEDNGKFYYTFTTSGGIDIREIKSYDDATELRHEVIYWSGNDGIVGDIWAPEIHKFGDRWYIVASALFDKNLVPEGTMPESKQHQDNNDYYRYGFVLESKTEDIFGEYEFKGRLAPDGLNNIDGTYLQKDGRLYYVCSAYVDVANQCLFISEMENPYTLKADSKAVKLSYPKFYWEKKGWKVNEGPAGLYKDDSIFIVYSASGFSSGGYCLGMLTLEGDDVMNASDWSKNSTRVLYHQPLKKIYNAGHCSFLYRDNDEIYMVYHATTTMKFDKSPRVTFVKPVKFVKGIPLFV